MVKPRVLRRISNYPITAHPAHTDRLSNHSTTHPTLKIKAGLKALEFGVMFSFATDNCVLSVVFSSVVFYAFLRFSFWLCGCFLFFVSCLNFRLGAVALRVRHWVCVGGVGGCAHPLSLPWLSAVMALRFCLVIIQAGNSCGIVTLFRRLPDLNAFLFSYFCSHSFLRKTRPYSRACLGRYCLVPLFPVSSKY